MDSTFNNVQNPRITTTTRALETTQNKSRARQTRATKTGSITKPPVPIVHIDFSVHVTGHCNTVVLPASCTSGLLEELKHWQESGESNIRIQRGVSVCGSNNRILAGNSVVQSPAGIRKAVDGDDANVKRKASVTSLNEQPKKQHIKVEENR